MQAFGVEGDNVLNSVEDYEAQKRGRCENRGDMEQQQQQKYKEVQHQGANAQMQQQKQAMQHQQGQISIGSRTCQQQNEGASESCRESRKHMDRVVWADSHRTFQSGMGGGRGQVAPQVQAVKCVFVTLLTQDREIFAA
jgi:hypothetical protein